MLRYNRGMTLMGFLMVLMVGGFLVFIGIRLFPVYSEYYSVVQAMKGVQAEPGVANMSPANIRKLLGRRFFVSYVENVKPENITISHKDGYTLRIAYERRVDFMYNIDFVVTFDKTVELTRTDSVD